MVAFRVLVRHTHTKPTIVPQLSPAHTSVAVFVLVVNPSRLIATKQGHLHSIEGDPRGDGSDS